MHNRRTAAKSYDHLAGKSALTWIVILPSSSPLEGSQRGSDALRSNVVSGKSSSPLEGSQPDLRGMTWTGGQGVVITPRGIATTGGPSVTMGVSGRHHP